LNACCETLPAASTARRGSNRAESAVRTECDHSRRRARGGFCSWPLSAIYAAALSHDPATNRGSIALAAILRELDTVTDASHGRLIMSDWEAVPPDRHAGSQMRDDDDEGPSGER
jgi:hypothetical protein